MPRAAAMMTGTVNIHGEPILGVTVRAVDGSEIQLNAVVDTGFNGSLTLPAATIAALGYSWRGRGSAELANGQLEEFDMFAGTVLWNGSPRAVLVESAETDPLIRTALLRGMELVVQNIPGGAVLVRALPVASP
ncbi:MAG TPA: hypothetical protein VGQ19_01925 [Burkholderiales bacterium]|nr:hypothetical protein [Burkholderiales bacterium]